MVFDSLKQSMGGTDTLNPMMIAQHTLFTAREKIELLNQVKAEVTRAQSEGDPLQFSPEEIDEAIAYVREGNQSGATAETVLKGDY